MSPSYFLIQIVVAITVNTSTIEYNSLDLAVCIRLSYLNIILNLPSHPGCGLRWTHLWNCVIKLIGMCKQALYLMYKITPYTIHNYFVQTIFTKMLCFLLSTCKFVDVSMLVKRGSKLFFYPLASLWNQCIELDLHLSLIHISLWNILRQ